jgi:hypothetical protein
MLEMQTLETLEMRTLGTVLETALGMETQAEQLLLVRLRRLRGRTTERGQSSLR